MSKKDKKEKSKIGNMYEQIPSEFLDKPHPNPNFHIHNFQNSFSRHDSSSLREWKNKFYHKFNTSVRQRRWNFL